MQFAGQRTDMDLNPVGEPVNVLVKLTEDVVPDPDAILITGITPQQTLQDGLTEVEFLKLFHDVVATPGTIFAGYNTVRFDDEFMRYLHYRNFYDPYEWQYTDDKSRWDLLDVVRMTRALRPAGIQWPTDDEGKATNRLELITKANGIDHFSAHDALSDVEAVIAVAKLIRQKQPKLFDYLLQARDKKSVARIVNQGHPFVYSSGKYPSEFEKTTIVGKLADHPKRQAALVFDLRYNPLDFTSKSVNELVAAWKLKNTEQGRLPVKTLQFNRCPAIAPLSVWDTSNEEHLSLTKQTALTHFKLLNESDLAEKVLAALDILDTEQDKKQYGTKDVDAQLYDGFFGDADRNATRAIRAADPAELPTMTTAFKDKRLIQLLPLYIARNFPGQLDTDSRLAWDTYKTEKLLGGGQQSKLAMFFNRLAELAADTSLSSDKQYILEELQLYGQSIVPVSEN